MNCYFCAPHHPGGTDFGNCSAIGICYRCGVGVCPEHGQKKTTSGALLLCFECAESVPADQEASQTPEKVPDPQVSLN
jgi:hypothetical protein